MDRVNNDNTKEDANEEGEDLKKVNPQRAKDNYWQLLTAVDYWEKENLPSGETTNGCPEEKKKGNKRSTLKLYTSK